MKIHSVHFNKESVLFIDISFHSGHLLSTKMKGFDPAHFELENPTKLVGAAMDVEPNGETNASGERISMMANDLVHAIVNNNYYEVRVMFDEEDFDPSAIERYLGESLFELAFQAGSVETLGVLSREYIDPPVNHKDMYGLTYLQRAQASRNREMIGFWEDWTRMLS